MPSLAGAPSPRHPLSEANRPETPASIWPARAGRLVMTAADKHGRDVARFPKNVSDQRFWTPNSAGLVWTITVDIDHPQAIQTVMEAVHLSPVVATTRPQGAPIPPEHRGFPVPSYVVVNPATTHAQATWIIDPVTVSEAGSWAPRVFLHDLRHALTATLGGDEAFTHGRARNPLCESAQVLWGETRPRTLREIKDGLLSTGRWSRDRSWADSASRTVITPVTASAAPCTGDVLGEGERNAGIFRLTSDYARSMAAAGAEATETALTAFAESIPVTAPISASEIRAIVASIMRWMATKWRGVAGPRGERTAKSLYQASRGRRGGLRRTVAQTAARATSFSVFNRRRQSAASTVYTEVIRLTEEGLTVAQISEALGVSRRTIFRARRAARDAAFEAEMADAHTPEEENPHEHAERPEHVVSPIRRPGRTAGGAGARAVLALAHAHGRGRADRWPGRDGGSGRAEGQSLGESGGHGEPRRRARAA